MYYYEKRLKLFNDFKDLVFRCEHDEKYQKLLKKSIDYEEKVESIDVYVTNNYVDEMLRTIDDIIVNTVFYPEDTREEIDIINKTLSMLKYKDKPVFRLRFKDPYIYLGKLKKSSINKKKPKYSEKVIVKITGMLHYIDLPDVEFLN